MVFCCALAAVLYLSGFGPRNPENWIIRSHTETAMPTSIAGQRVYFYAEKFITCEFNSGYTGWRLQRLWYDVVFYFWDGLYLLLPVIALSSPFGVRALYEADSFYPGKTVNDQTGELEPASTEVHSVRALLRELHRTVARKRANFEEEPDTGLMGKGCTRVLHMMWWYGFVYGIGTAVLGALYPAAIILCVLLCLALAATWWVWAPMLGLLDWLFHVTCYDKDFPEGDRNWKLYNPRVLRKTCCCLYRYVTLPLLSIAVIELGVTGVGQIALCMAACVIHPTLAAIIWLYAHARWGIRRGWDSFIYWLFLKRLARVPQSDTWAARRVSGPQMPSQYFYQVGIEESVLMMLSSLEQEEMSVWKTAMEVITAEPLAAEQQFKNVLGSTEVAVYQTSNASAQENIHDVRCQLNGKLSENYQRRIDKLPVLPHVDRERLRCRRSDLQVFQQMGPALVQRYVLERILPSSRQSLSEFWDRHDLPEGAWDMLCDKHIKQVFGDEFLTPIEDLDTIFHLEINHIDAHEYVGSLLNPIKRPPREDLEVAAGLQTVLSKQRPTAREPLIQSDMFTGRSAVIRWDYIGSCHILLPCFGLLDTHSDESLMRILAPAEAAAEQPEAVDEVVVTVTAPLLSSAVADYGSTDVQMAEIPSDVNVSVEPPATKEVVKPEVQF